MPQFDVQRIPDSYDWTRDSVNSDLDIPIPRLGNRSSNFGIGTIIVFSIFSAQVPRSENQLIVGKPPRFLLLEVVRSLENAAVVFVNGSSSPVFVLRFCNRVICPATAMRQAFETDSTLCIVVATPLTPTACPCVFFAAIVVAII
jgi:hypothetical protein